MNSTLLSDQCTTCDCDYFAAHRNVHRKKIQPCFTIFSPWLGGFGLSLVQESKYLLVIPCLTHLKVIKTQL